MLRTALLLALISFLLGVAAPAALSTTPVAEAAPTATQRAFFDPSADLDTSRVEDVRNQWAALSDMYAQELGWTDGLPLDQYGWETVADECAPAECLASALESQGWFIRYDVATDRLLAYPPAR